jgi:serine/threonine protein kinase
LTEVSIHLRLRNEHILQLYNVIEDEDYVYLVLELCSGGTLAQFLKHNQQIKQQFSHKSKNKTLNDSSIESKNKTQNETSIEDPILSYDIIADIIRQLCLGLNYLHRNSIVHRDLNLNNVLLFNPYQNNNQLVIKIADFGLAIDLNSSKVQNMSSKPHREDHVIPLPLGTTICGTPGFISPEVWSQMQTVSPKSDIFSLGSILYSCISGFTPKGELVSYLSFKHNFLICQKK